MKHCAGCDRVLPMEAFSFRRNGHVISPCKECRRVIQKVRPTAETREAKKRYRARHAVKIAAYRREHGRRPESKARRLALLKQRKASDPAFAIECALRRTLADEIRKAVAKKVTGTVELLGCSMSDFLSHIERQWQPGMSWSNWGRGAECWNIDHVRPISSFDLTRPDHQRACFHFSNMQPLWSLDNLRKGSHFREGMCGV